MDDKIHERIFKGVWIPAEVWDNMNLSWMEKCLWAEINALGTENKPCFASNAYLAKMFHSTESSISNMISKLKSLNMVKHLSYDGRCRRMVAILPIETSPTGEVRVHSQVKSDSTHRCNIDTIGVSKKELPLNPPKLNSDSSVETSQSADNPQHFPDPQRKTTLRSTEEEKTATAVKKAPPNSARPPRNTEADFDKLWAAYPRKDNKAGAKKSFLRVEVSIDTLIAAVNAQKRLWNDPKFIPYLQTWLNQKRWEDESIVKQAEDAPNAPQKKTGWVAQAEDDLQSFKNWMLENRPEEWNEHLPSMDMRWWVEYGEKKNAVEF